MSEPGRPTFEQCALASGLLSQGQIDDARAGVGWSAGDEPDAVGPLGDEQLADRLVRMGRLNAWQAKQLLDGRTKFNLGAYVIVDSIGQGGMGQVFKAEHSVMGRVVAIKVLPLSKTTPDAVASFTREIRALARLDHPRLVRALDAGFDGNVYYLVTEYVPGCDLRKLVRREGPLGMTAAASIAHQVAEGLAHAHAHGLVHRDVKPGNVLVTPDGEAKLLDLGLAGPVEGDAENDPRYGKIVGTADFLAPDHIKSPWDPTPAWDVYSLGCTLYYAVTGKVPFPGGSTAEKARAHLELRPLDPRRLNRALTDEFVEAMADMMAKTPAERTQSALEVMRRLTPWVEPRFRVSWAEAPGPQSPTMAPPASTPPPIAVPPPIAARRDARSRRRDTPAAKDAEAAMRAAPDAASSQESPSVVLDVDIDDARAARPAGTGLLPDGSTLFRAILLLVLAPLALVGAVMILTWIIRAILGH